MREPLSQSGAPSGCRIAASSDSSFKQHSLTDARDQALVTPSLADVSELIRMMEKHLCDDPDVQKMVPWIEATLTRACRVAR